MPPSVCVQPARLLTLPPPPLACSPSPCTHPPGPSPSPCAHSSPLCASPLVILPPLARGPSPCVHPPQSLLRPPACAQRGRACVRGGARKPGSGVGIARAEGTSLACRRGWQVGQGRAHKLGGPIGTAMLMEQPTQMGSVSKWGCHRNGGGQHTFCTPCLCGKVG